MEENNPKKLLDQIRACPGLGAGMPSTLNTIAPSRPRPAESDAALTLAHIR
jgi:hypothetical protein